MSSNVNSVSYTIRVALILCALCSVFISSAAVLLKPMQTANQLLDRNRNILQAAGLFDAAVNTDAEVPALFNRFKARLVDLETGRFLTDEQAASLGLDPANYDEAAARNDQNLSIALPADQDVANIKRRVRYATVYVIEDSEGNYETLVLPVSGYGLWGIMYGYLAIEGDGETIKGIAFYQHSETPGLGGEISNPRWQALWAGKQIYDTEGNVAFRVVKGGGQGPYQVDSLSGASLTSRGVQNMIAFWLGEDGFKKFISNEVKG